MQQTQSVVVISIEVQEARAAVGIPIGNFDLFIEQHSLRKNRIHVLRHTRSREQMQRGASGDDHPYGEYIRSRTLQRLLDSRQDLGKGIQVCILSLDLRRHARRLMQDPFAFLPWEGIEPLAAEIALTTWQRLPEWRFLDEESRQVLDTALVRNLGRLRARRPGPP